MTSVLEQDLTATQALEVALHKLIAEGNDEAAVSTLALLLGRYGDPGEKEKPMISEGRTAVAYTFLNSEAYKLRRRKNERGLPKTAALLWKTLFEGILAMDDDSDQRQEYTTLIGRRYDGDLADAEKNAVGEAIRKTLNDSDETISCCYQILANASYTVEHDDVFRIVARSLASRAEDRHLKAAGMFLWALGPDTVIHKEHLPAFEEAGEIMQKWLAHVYELQIGLQTTTGRLVSVETGFEQVTLTVENLGQVGTQDWETEMVERLREWGREIREREAGWVQRPYQLALAAARKNPEKGVERSYIKIAA